ncbi:MAG: hypothetical protein K1X50_07340, partial [Candidatus Promineofilum sp.]|nr:hypothetical protein [Promineifilum sp.]
MDIYLEEGAKRMFAGALEWPGWCRAGRDEAAARRALLDYAPRYAAVAGRASAWERKETRAQVEVTWDGPGYSFQDLCNVLSSLAPGQAEPRLRELAAALGGARNLGDLSFESSGGRLSIQGTTLLVSPENGPAHNRFVLRRKGLKAWLPSRPAPLDRACFAPLRLTPGRPTPPIRVDVLLQVGEPPLPAVQAARVHLLESTPWGCGFAWSGPDPAFVVRHGVAYPIELPVSGLGLIWWTDSLPVDASYRQLVEGPELLAW